MATQASFEECGTALAAVEFCVVDLETTGGSPRNSAITEIAAVKVLRGEITGTFQTLVDPGTPVPAFIRLLTGLSDEVLADAPPLSAVLPSFLEFARDTVIVAHNARFDLSFLNHALIERGYDRLPNPVLDTAALARKIVAGEVPNHRLATLSSSLRCAHQPCHRAMPDVLATIDVLHHLIERVAGFGIVTLEDLMSLSSARMDGTFAKISLTDGLPKTCGVYRFLGPTGNTLYVGKATNVRARVRSYFYGDPRRKIRDLLRETQAIAVETHASLLEAEVSETRAIHRESPPYNRVGKQPAPWYLKISLAGRRGKVGAARVAREDGSLYLGPFRSLRQVKVLMEALRDAAPLHRCSDPHACHGCAFSDMKRCVGSNPEAHRALVVRVAELLRDDPSPLYAAIQARMHRLARQRRFEEAVDARERGAFLEHTLSVDAKVRAMLAAEQIVLRHGDRIVVIRYAQLASAGRSDGDEQRAADRLERVAVASPVGSFMTREQHAEARAIASWIDRHADELHLVRVRGAWALPVTVRPSGRLVPRDPR